MNIRYQFTYIKKASRSCGRDICIHDGMLIGTWYCVRLSDQRVLWETDEKSIDADRIVGVYRDVIVATKIEYAYMGYSPSGFYRVSMHTGQLLPDCIREQKMLFGLLHTSNRAYPERLVGEYAWLSDKAVINVLTGERIAQQDTPLPDQRLPEPVDDSVETFSIPIGGSEVRDYFNISESDFGERVRIEWISSTELKERCLVSFVDRVESNSLARLFFPKRNAPILAISARNAIKFLGLDPITMMIYEKNVEIPGASYSYDIACSEDYLVVGYSLGDFPKISPDYNNAVYALEWQRQSDK